MLRNLTTQRSRRTGAEVAEQKTFHGKAGIATCEEPDEVLVEFLRWELRGVSWRSLRLEAVVLRRTRNHWFETAPFPRAHPPSLLRLSHLPVIDFPAIRSISFFLRCGVRKIDLWRSW